MPQSPHQRRKTATKKAQIGPERGRFRGDQFPVGAADRALTRLFAVSMMLCNIFIVRRTSLGGQHGGKIGSGNRW